MLLKIPLIPSLFYMNGSQVSRMTKEHSIIYNITFKSNFFFFEILVIIMNFFAHIITGHTLRNTI